MSPLCDGNTERLTLLTIESLLRSIEFHFHKITKKHRYIAIFGIDLHYDKINNKKTLISLISIK